MSADVLPFAIAGGALYLLSLPKASPRRKPVEQVQDYTKTWQPVAPLSQVLFSNSVRGKNVILLRTERGAEGTIRYVYQIPDCNQLVTSYAPLEMHQAL
jgi:hypothetical protein